MGGRRMFRGLAVAIAALAASPAASAAVYEVETPGYHLLFRTERHRVASLRGFIRTHCSDGRTSRQGFHYSEFNRRIDDKGHFAAQFEASFDEGSLFFKIGGHVDKTAIAGTFVVRQSFAFPGEFRSCWSGRSRSHATVRYVARRR